MSRKKKKNMARYFEKHKKIFKAKEGSWRSKNDGNDSLLTENKVIFHKYMDLLISSI